MNCGSNSIKVKHVAQYSGEVNCYEFVLTRQSNNSTRFIEFEISSLIFYDESSNSLNSLDQDDYSSQFYVGFMQSQLTIDITPSSYGRFKLTHNSDASTESSGYFVFNSIYELSYGSNSFHALSTTQSGNENSFVMNIFREHAIKELYISNFDEIIWENTEFNSNTFTYNCSFDFFKYQLIFNVTADNSNSLVYYFEHASQGTNSFFTLNCGSNSIKVKHVAQYSGEVNCYEFILTRQSNNSTRFIEFEMSSLIFYDESSNSLNSLGQDDYSSQFYVGFRQSQLTIDITPSSYGRFKLTHNSDASTESSGYFVFNSIYELSYGSNSFHALSTTQSGNENSFVMNIFREHAINSFTISNNGINLNGFQFSSNCFDYNFYVLYSSQSLVFNLGSTPYTNCVFIHHSHNSFYYSDTNSSITLGLFQNCIEIIHVAQFSSEANSYTIHIFKNSDTNTNMFHDVDSFKLSTIFYHDAVQSNCYFFQNSSQSIHDNSWIYWVNNCIENSFLCGFDVEQVQIDFYIPNRGSVLFEYLFEYELSSQSFSWFTSSSNSCIIPLSGGLNSVVMTAFAEDVTHSSSYTFLIYKEPTTVYVYSSNVAEGSSIGFLSTTFVYELNFSGNEENSYYIYFDSNNHIITYDITNSNNGDLTFNDSNSRFVAQCPDDTIEFKLYVESKIIQDYQLTYLITIDSTKSSNPHIPLISINYDDNSIAVYEYNKQNFIFSSNKYTYSKDIHVPYYNSEKITIFIHEPLRGS